MFADLYSKMKRTLFYYFFIFNIAAFIFPNFSLCQISPFDSLSKATAPVDSSTSSPTISDPKVKSKIKMADVGIKSKVTYSARTIESNKKEGIIHLIGDAEVKYEKIQITAGKIHINWDESFMLAEVLEDTSSTDSTQNRKTGFPVFSDGNEKMVGESMVYNFKSDKGRIVRGRTEIQKGQYFGKVIKRTEGDVFFVKGGRYSSCENEEPHYSFRGDKMKVIMNDKILAKPVTLWLGKIPLAVFPFAMFPTEESGRQSGVILPQYGSSAQEGRYLRGMGYYWATNDYLDFQTTMDFYERTGILLRGKTNYALRYKFSGSLGGSFTHKNFPNGQRQRRWNLNVNHRQTINEKSSLSINGSFVNDNSFYKDFSNNRSERLNRQITSNATYNTRWGNDKNSLTINLKQVKDVESGSETLTLPQFNFSRSRTALLPFEADERDKEKQPRWFNEIYYTYTASGSNIIKDDTTGSPAPDIRTAAHGFRFSHAPGQKLLNVIGVSQSLSYNEDWFDNRKTYQPVDTTNNFPATKENGFFRRYKYSYSANAGTKLFGTVYPRIFGVKAIRHTMSPQISFSFQPDFSDKYFETRIDTNGVERKLDKFTGSPSSKQMSMGFSLGNLFQMKSGKTDREKVTTLFSFNMNSSYNFVADSLKIRDMTSAFSATPTKTLNLSANFTHTFYRFDEILNRRIDDFIKPRLTAMRIGASWSLGGKSTSGAASPAKQTPIVGAGNPTASGQYKDSFAPESAFSAKNIPWQAKLRFTYNVTRFNPNSTQKTAQANLENVEVKLTKNWRIGYRLSYDLVKTEIIDQRLSLYRNLHCWEARFDWTPSGNRSGFYFIINVKAPHLKQLKYEYRGAESVFSQYQ